MTSPSRKQKQRQKPRRKPQRPKAPKARRAQHKEICLPELQAILERAKTSSLSEDDYANLKGAVDTLAFLTQELEAKGTSIRRLRKLIFGARTEKTSQVLGERSEPRGAEAATADDAVAPKGDPDSSQQKKRKGHGRNGAAAYRGAEKVKVANETLKSGDQCPECLRGKVYLQTEPAVLVRVTGMAPLLAKVYELERLRCNACGQVFTAAAPQGVGDVKYDETAAGMIALLKYGSGLPFNRLERLERGLGIPLPAATQWEVVQRGAGLLEPAYAELVRQAAQGTVLYNDDTTMKVLELNGATRQEAEQAEDANDRTGVFTSGIVSTTEGHQIALFFTGRKHAGENLADVLAQRAAELSPPIQMCDALSRNTAGDFESILANFGALCRTAHPCPLRRLSSLRARSPRRNDETPSDISLGASVKQRVGPVCVKLLLAQNSSALLVRATRYKHPYIHIFSC